jgi:hypothetical protein
MTISSLQTPEERLCSRTWRLVNSRWLLWSILSFGLLTGVGFLIHAITTKNRRLLISAVIWLAVGATYVALSTVIDSGTKANPAQTPASQFLGGFVFAMWVGGVTHSALSNRSWLRWKAEEKPKGAWYASTDSPSAGSRSRDAQPAGVQEAFKTVGVEPHQSDPPLLIDINSASVTEIMSLGADEKSAKRIVEQRAKYGSFENQDDLLQKSQVPPHVILSMGSSLTYVAVSDKPNLQNDTPTESPTRRKLDF